MWSSGSTTFYLAHLKFTSVNNIKLIRKLLLEGNTHRN